MVIIQNGTIKQEDIFVHGLPIQCRMFDSHGIEITLSEKKRNLIQDWKTVVESGHGKEFRRNIKTI